MTLNVLDLFSGIGGFSLGLERAGMRTVAFCECDAYCRRVLARHWPTVPVYDDVRTLTGKQVLADTASQRLEGTKFQSEWIEQQPRAGNSGIDVICGGFPCQDVSYAGKGAGIGGARSGLWSEYARIIGEVRPRYVIVENVAALLGRGIERVLGDLAALGFDAEWHCIPASAVGAPHRRDRVWVVAYAANQLQQGRPFSEKRQWVSDSSQDVPQPNGAGREQQRWDVSVQAQLAAAECADWWRIEPCVGRVAHGVPARVDRLRALGNAVVPQIPEIIGRAIINAGL